MDLSENVETTIRRNPQVQMNSFNKNNRLQVPPTVTIVIHKRVAMVTSEVSPTVTCRVLKNQ